MDSLDLDRMNHAVRGTLFHGRLHHFATVDSTNTRALADAHAGADAGQVYIADEQTAGRGRGGHTWQSGPGGGLYMTVLVRPALQSGEVLKLSLAAALAAYWAIHEITGYSIDVRWPNDLVTPPSASSCKKLGGILTETASTPDGTLRHAAVGIGINLNQAVFPDALRDLATSLRLTAEVPISREAMTIALLQRLHRELARLTETSNDLFRRFQEVSTWARGKRVRVAEDEGYTGTTDGLNEAGLLRVRSDDGTLRIVRHGGVREL